MNVSLLNKLCINKEALWLPVSEAARISRPSLPGSLHVPSTPETSFAGNCPPPGVTPYTSCFVQIGTRWFWAAPAGTQGFFITIKDDIEVKGQ